VFQNNYGGVLARGDVVARGKKWRTTDEINHLCKFIQGASGGISTTHIFRNLIQAVGHLQSN
jgi:uncharacterized membrane protein YsdA (DUF1294 family)